MPSPIEAQLQLPDKPSVATPETPQINFTEIIVPLVIALGKSKERKEKTIKIQTPLKTEATAWIKCYSRCPQQSCLGVCNGLADHDGPHNCDNGHTW